MHAILTACKHAIREPFAWPGGYPVYIVLSDGEMLCATCAHENWPLIVRATLQRDSSGWRAEGAQILWGTEDGPELCAHCRSALVSAYGEVSL